MAVHSTRMHTNKEARRGDLKSYHRAPNGSFSFSCGAARGSSPWAHPDTAPDKRKAADDNGARLWQSPAAALTLFPTHCVPAMCCGWAWPQPRSTGRGFSRSATVPGRSDVQTSKPRARLETAIGKHVGTVALRGSVRMHHFHSPNFAVLLISEANVV